MSVPEIPGTLVPHRSDQERWLKSHVARLCNLEHERFPGSQPVSFGRRDLEKLERQDFWVCEKSDGIRVLLLVHTDLPSKTQTIYLIDRHNAYRQNPLRNSIIDGELVLDLDPHTNKQTMRFLAFDCLVINDQNVMSRALPGRYGRLTEWFLKPYAKMRRDYPNTPPGPFEIKVKEMTLSYYAEKVFAVDIPALQHGTTGSFTPALKWKPPSENSIDFKLVLRFPPLGAHPDRPDFLAKPLFLLHVWCGGAKYELYDEMHVTDDEWDEMKRSGEQIDDRIVEVHWDTALGRWRMMRFRDDKPNGNHQNVVENIIQSIADGVEKDMLLSRSPSIRSAWKAREGAPQSSSQQQQHAAPTRNGPPALRRAPPEAELRYGPLASSPWSRVSGPPTIAGMQR
ncbi:mRNA capping enzyme [Infundibulicybe gibba]|nr:mRNA capping enzyme [Infundibulicybe gibba]